MNDDPRRPDLKMVDETLQVIFLLPNVTNKTMPRHDWQKSLIYFKEGPFSSDIMMSG